MTIEERITELQKQLDELKEQVKNGTGVFNRVPLKDTYYRVRFAEGKAYAEVEIEDDNSLDSNSFANNNYFLTEERAKEVAEKINVLLKMERIHDTLCPEYKPDWTNGTETKCDISTNCRTGKIEYQLWGVNKTPVATYFPEDKIEAAIELYKEMF